MKFIIVAYDKRRLIGGNDILPWQANMKADMNRFRNITIGNAVIMGRKTYDSIGKPLLDRQNIVITHKSIKIPGVQIASSLDEAYGLVKPGLQTFVIGGGEIFKQAINQTDIILATEIDAVFNGEIYFPALSNSWIKTAREFHHKDKYNLYDYSFVTFSKRR